MTPLLYNESHLAEVLPSLQVPLGDPRLSQWKCSVDDNLKFIVPDLLHERNHLVVALRVRLKVRRDGKASCLASLRQGGRWTGGSAGDSAGGSTDGDQALSTIFSEGCAGFFVSQNGC